MAYLIFNSDNQLVRIAENDAEKTKVSPSSLDFTEVDVSTDDFNAVKFGTKLATYDGTNVTYTNMSPQITSAENLTAVINMFKEVIQDWIDSHSGHADITKWTNYKTQIEAVNPTTVFSSLSSSDAWHEQTGSSGEGNDKKYTNKAEIAAAEANSETVTKTNIIGCSLEKYFDHKSQTSLSLLQLPI